MYSMRVFAIALSLFAAHQASMNHAPVCAVADDLASLPIIQWDNLTKEQIEGFFSQKERFIVACPAGTQLPVKLSVKGDIFTMRDIEQTITILKECYVAYSNGQLLIRTKSGGCWKSPQEFYTGSLHALFTTDHGKIEAEVTAELNERI